MDVLLVEGILSVLVNGAYPVSLLVNRSVSVAVKEVFHSVLLKRQAPTRKNTSM